MATITDREFADAMELRGRAQREKLINATLRRKVYSVCDVVGCGGRVLDRGLCVSHLQRESGRRRR